MRAVCKSLCIVTLALSAAAAFCQQPFAAGIDANAAAIIDRALQAMGGADAWRSVQAVRVEGTVQEQDFQTGAIRTHHFTQRHDWSAGQVQSHHEVVDAKGQPLPTADPDIIRTREQAEKAKGALRDPGNALPACLPGALLASLRHGRQYRVTADVVAGGAPPAIRDLVVFPPGPQYAYLPAQIWTFSTETGLPLRARITIGGGRRATATRKTILYRWPPTAKPSMLPTAVEIQHPDGIKQTITFEGAEFVPAKGADSARHEQ
jgi:hypothetical protein